MAEPDNLLAYLAQRAANSPARLALADANRELSYADYERAVGALARRLRAGGVAPGAAVAVALPKSVSLPIAYLGTAAAGAIAFPVDPKAGPRVWEDILKRFAPAAVVTSREATLPLADASLPIVAAEDAFDQEARAAAIDDAVPADTIFYLNMTSGLTGRPQAAAATHGNIVANTRAAVNALALTPDDVHLVTFAAHAHPHECFARALILGGTAVFLESILPGSILRTVERFGVTVLMGVPPLFRSLLPLAADFAKTRLRVAEAGGMTTRQILRDDFKGKFGIPLRRVWGSTETSGIAFLAAEDAPEGSLGFPLATYEARILAEDGRELPPGEVGELVLKGPGCVGGYWRRGRLEPAKEPWLPSGDLARREPDGSFTFVDRKQGLMKVAGEKVFAAEIERALAEHPAVAEVAVVPREDEVRGQVPVAYVVPFPHLTVSRADLTAFAAGALPPIKRPKAIFVVPSLPSAGSGKVDKKQLDGDFEAGKEALAAVDDELLRLLNRRYELLRNAGDALTAGELERSIQRIVAANPGPLHDETVADILRKLNELQGR